MLGANFAEAIRGKQTVKNCFLFVCGPRFSDHQELTGHDCRKIEGSQKLLHKIFHEITEFHFAKYRFSFRKVQIFVSQSTDFHFAKYRFSFRKVQISFRKVQIFISQSTDFVSFRFAKYHLFFAKYNKPVIIDFQILALTIISFNDPSLVIFV